ncbi:hypothetical protein [Terrilactibacillus laevilacticus]|uniref:Uncharacterized protein n=1 Tax=Terrilactibacillus laevilacticus TaxID=1380157 RepID=A0ABW5PVJ5_9BACI|nr:hypothetical protein [Terrilactibacillus laevilacticus]
MDQILEAIQKMNENFSNELKEIKSDIKAMKNQLDRIELNGNEDVIGMLIEVKKQTSNLNTDITNLAGKVGVHDMIINRLSNI